MLQLDDYVQMSIRSNQERAAMFHRNAIICHECGEQSEAVFWQKRAQEEAAISRLWLGITEKDYEYEHLSP